MLRSILPIWRSKSILMRADAAGAEACGALAVGVSVADLLVSGEAEISGNAAAPRAAAMPSFRKLRRAGSLMVIEVSPFAPRVDLADSEAEWNPSPNRWPSGRHEYPWGNVYSSTGEFAADDFVQIGNGGSEVRIIVGNAELTVRAAESKGAERAVLSGARIKYMVLRVNKGDSRAH